MRQQISASSTGAQESMRNISQSALASIEVALPPEAEQRRIVETLEHHLSRLDLGEHTLDAALARCRSYRRSWLLATTHSVAAEAVRLDAVADVRLGRQRSPKNHGGDSMFPYLRAANITWSGLKLDDVKEMNFTDKELATYRLRPGDVLLSEASGSPREVGKPALWQGEIENCCFQNTLIRVRPTGILPEFLLHYLRAEAMAGRFADNSRGVGIHHLGATALAGWKVVLPDDEVQAKIVAQIDETEPILVAVETAIAKQVQRSKNLRNSLLRAASSGKLVAQDPSDEVASELLERIEVERRRHGVGRRALRARSAAAPKMKTDASTGHQEELWL
ncbi:restriction endonuclease subunit S [Polymorphospora rubra]|uniref:restriction endonuclease subunit S n=1 Tax=Polymorphospora rubra TaxID=338584 RepID=UPI001BB43305|nr:restriction endonuclease subunit S [Polymorphospora rubra]